METQTMDKEQAIKDSEKHKSQITKDPEEYKEQAIEDSEEHEIQAIEDIRADDSGISIADTADKADNKTDEICEDSNNRD